MSQPTAITDEDAKLDAIFHALADRSRRRILHLLRHARRLRVGDIAQAFEMSLNAVSKHLKTLERAELIERDVRGREHWLSPNASALELVTAARNFVPSTRTARKSVRPSS